MLAILLSIVTFTISSKSLVVESGDVPAGTTAAYNCTYQKGTLTAGNSATLTLTGWQNVDISKVVLYMKSNKTSGAGSLTMKADDVLVWSIANTGFNSSKWAYGYKTEYVPVTHTFSTPISGKVLSLEVKSTENSLYISHYEIEYTRRTPVAHTITCETGIDTIHFPPITESAAGEGVLLPQITWQAEDWYFLGWTTSPVIEETKCTAFVSSGTRFFPKEDMTLYALYTNQLNHRWTAASELRSGRYLITSPGYKSIFQGDAVSGYIPLTAGHVTSATVMGEPAYVYTMADWEADQVYYLEFSEDSTLTIRNELSGNYLGIRQNKVALASYNWQYRTYSDGTVLLYSSSEQGEYVLQIAETLDKMQWAKLSGTGKATIGGFQTGNLCFFYLPDSDTGAKWSSDPRRMLPVEETHFAEPSQQAYDIPFGNYILRIQNQKKYLIIHP